MNKKSGQALTEYVLLMALIAGMFVILVGPLSNLMAILERPLREDFPHVYRYGDPKARGEDEGGPERLPRVFKPGNYRMFGPPSR